MTQHRRQVPSRRIRGNGHATPVARPKMPARRADDTPALMRALTLIYHEDMEPDITGIIERKMTIARYTKIHNVVGARSESLRNADITVDGQNHMLIIVATEDVILDVAQALRELRQNKGHGLRGYITPVEGLI